MPPSQPFCRLRIGPVVFQVVVGFVLSAYLTLPLVFWLYMTSLATAKTQMDRAFLAFWRCRNLSPTEAYTPLAQRCVLMISDQQLVTGLAVLAAGFTQLRTGISTFY